MTFLAGQKVTATLLNNHVLRTVEARSSGDETVTTSVTDVNGATVTINTPVDNTVVKVDSIWDLATSGGTDTFLGTLYVDGVLQANVGEAHFEGAGAERYTVAQSWNITIATAGSHTLKLRRQKTSNSDVLTLYSIHTKIQVSGLGIS